MDAEIRSLGEEMSVIATNARAKLQEIKDDTPEERSKEVEREFDKMMVDHDKLEEKRNRLMKLSAAEKLASQSSGDAPNDDGQGSGEDNGEEIDYRSAFHEMLRNGGDVSALDAEYRDALKGGVDVEARAQLTSTGAAGGFTVPTELSTNIIEAMEATGPMYNGDVVFTLDTASGNEIQIPSIDDTEDSSTETHTEGSGITDDGSGDIAFGQQLLNAYMFKTPFIKWSPELGADSILAVEALLRKIIGRRLGKIANAKLTTGTGSNEPHGVVTASSQGIVAASATAFTAEELIELQDSLDEAYEGDTSWMMKKATRTVVRKLKDGDNNLLWQMGNIKDGTPEQLLGRPLRLNEAMVTPSASSRPIIYGDMKEYYVRRVGSPVIGVMRERFWPNLGIAGLIRFDGEIGDSRAIKHLAMAAS